MSEDRPTVLVIGYGNPGRQDDGLGPAFAERIESLNLPGVDVDAGYQLMVEDAEAAAQHDVVVFVDADATDPNPYYFRPLTPVRQESFSSHSVAPAAVLALAHEMFGARTAGYVLGIRGMSFDMFVTELTAAAADHLERTLDFFVPVLRDRDFDAAVRRGVGEPESHNA